MQNKSIYKLELHEITTTSSGVSIMRVPGGWIYDCWDLNNDFFKGGTFVPFTNDLREQDDHAE